LSRDCSHNFCRKKIESETRTFTPHFSLSHADIVPSLNSIFFSFCDPLPLSCPIYPPLLPKSLNNFVHLSRYLTPCSHSHVSPSFPICSITTQCAKGNNLPFLSSSSSKLCTVALALTRPPTVCLASTPSPLIGVAFHKPSSSQTSITTPMRARPSKPPSGIPPSVTDLTAGGGTHEAREAQLSSPLLSDNHLSTSLPSASCPLVSACLPLPCLVISVFFPFQ
jgi:hypothetical protein